MSFTFDNCIRFLEEFREFSQCLCQFAFDRNVDFLFSSNDSTRRVRIDSTFFPPNNNGFFYVNEEGLSWLSRHDLRITGIFSTGHIHH